MREQLAREYDAANGIIIPLDPKDTMPAFRKIVRLVLDGLAARNLVARPDLAYKAMFPFPDAPGYAGTRHPRRGRTDPRTPWGRGGALTGRHTRPRARTGRRILQFVSGLSLTLAILCAFHVGWVWWGDAFDGIHTQQTLAVRHGVKDVDAGDATRIAEPRGGDPPAETEPGHGGRHRLDVDTPVQATTGNAPSRKAPARTCSPTRG